MPNINLLINDIEKNLFSLMHNAPFLFLNFDDKNDIVVLKTYLKNIEIINATPKVRVINDLWNSPAIGEVVPVKSVLIRHDGIVVWV